MTNSAGLQATLELPHLVLRISNIEACYRFDPEERQLIQLARAIAMFLRKNPDEDILRALFGEPYNRTAEKCLHLRHDAESGKAVLAVVIPQPEIPLDDQL